MAERKVKQWITVNGVHVPIFEGESKEDAVKKHIDQIKTKKGPKLGDKPHKLDPDRKRAQEVTRNAEAKDKYGKDWYALDDKQKAEIDRQLEKNHPDWYGKQSGVTRKDVEELTAKRDSLKNVKLNAKPISKEEVEANQKAWGKQPTEQEMRDLIKSKGHEKFVDELSGHTESGYKKALQYVYDQDTLSKEDFKKKYFGDGGKQTETQKQLAKDFDEKEKQIARNNAERERLSGNFEAELEERSDLGYKNVTEGVKTEKQANVKSAWHSETKEEHEEYLRRQSVAKSLGLPQDTMGQLATHNFSKEGVDKAVERGWITKEQADKINGKKDTSTRYYTKSQLENSTFRKDALEEMRRYERNWSFYTAREKRDISPNGVKELRNRIKEIENYEADLRKRKKG